MSLTETFNNWQEANLIGYLDRALVATLCRMSGATNPMLLLPALLAQQSMNNGNSYADLQTKANMPLESILQGSNPDSDEDKLDITLKAIRQQHSPNWQDWCDMLQNDPTAKILYGNYEDKTPFVFIKPRLYVRRFRGYELDIIVKTKELINNKVAALPAPNFALAPYSSLGEKQKEALRQALSRRFSIISGGPGTGKTHTLAALVLHLLQQPEANKLRLALAAPTGKAAARVQQSLKNSFESMRAAATQASLDSECLPKASTIHRLLGSLPNTPYFRHDSDNPLELDLLIVDEAGMIDLPLMAKMLSALPKHARLIMVGDAAQLASVEPGRVYGDFCRAAENSGSMLYGCLTKLDKSRRFPDNSVIGKASRAIRAGNAQAAWQTLKKESQKSEQQAGARLFELHDVNYNLANDRNFCALIKEGYAKFLASKTPAEALQHTADFTILTPWHVGLYGTKSLNRLILNILSGQDGFNPQGRFFSHQLIMIDKNSPETRLFNGDTGVVFPDPEQSGRLCAFFPTTDPGKTYKLALPRLPEYQRAFALTIHKSHGAEFEQLAMILPGSSDSPLLTRELLYTGLTRTKSIVHLWCSWENFEKTVTNQVTRSSGLFLDLCQTSQ
ncbi:MAG: exodeoxyribonuclease V subunit alpha [Oligosphaeraceae bacterium]|nr:exodeoxyribonuclease V subunit alpha [Oligosphaeraceae bacterium]